MDVTLNARDVEILLGLPGRAVTNEISMASEGIKSPGFRLAFKEAHDAQITVVEALLKQMGFVDAASLQSPRRDLATAMTRPDIIRRDLERRAHTPSYEFGKSSSFPDHAIAAKISEGGLKHLKAVAAQFLARQPFALGTKDGDMYRLPVPKGEGALETRQRLLTACNILGLTFTLGDSEFTKDRALKFDEPKTVAKITQILELAKAYAPNAKGSDPYTYTITG